MNNNLDNDLDNKDKLIDNNKKINCLRSLSNTLASFSYDFEFLASLENIKNFICNNSINSISKEMNEIPSKVIKPVEKGFKKLPKDVENGIKDVFKQGVQPTQPRDNDGY